jgi:dihydroorotate dehydrogenase (fumarate)/dihydroorotate dehydrogenase
VPHGVLYRRALRPLLFRLDAERAHRATLRACGALGRTAAGRALIRTLYGFEDARLRTTVGGIAFPNPLGLPAGFDKNGTATEALAALGFGSIDVGSVSARPSAGNPERPRLFRIPADAGLIVFYGVPNDGAGAVAARLARIRLPIPLGISLVETNSGTPGPVDEVIAELAAAARPFVTFADYLALNLNCPNSAGGFSHFDDPAHLRALLAALREIEGMVPVFIRVTPPRDPRGIDAVLAALDPFPFVKGLSFYDPKNDLRPRLRTPAAELARMRGSVSAPVARDWMQATIREWYRRIDRRRLALVGCGGIGSAEDAYRTIRLGASLVQVYTALVYQGPGLVREIKRGLARLLERDGFRSVAEAVGVDNAAPAPR